MKTQKKQISPLSPDKRHLPVYKYSIGEIKDDIMDGELLFEYIVLQYKRKSEREYLDATLPLDYLEKVKKQYYHGNNYIPVPWSNKRIYTPNQEYTDYIKSPEWRELRKRILSTRNICECAEQPIANYTFTIKHIRILNTKKMKTCRCYVTIAIQKYTTERLDSTKPRRSPMNKILDSGTRREFETGAVRDISENKGRCDLLPLRDVAHMLDSIVLECIDAYVRTGNIGSLYDAVRQFVSHMVWEDCYSAILEVSKQYEQGCIKYGERNWEKGIPVHCYIDSGVRHYLKFMRGDKDEPHDRAFVWNLLGAIWTHRNKPELIDLPFIKK